MTCSFGILETQATHLYSDAETSETNRSGFQFCHRPWVQNSAKQVSTGHAQDQQVQHTDAVSYRDWKCVRDFCLVTVQLKLWRSWPAQCTLFVSLLVSAEMSPQASNFHGLYMCRQSFSNVAHGNLTQRLSFQQWYNGEPWDTRQKIAPLRSNWTQRFHWWHLFHKQMKSSLSAPQSRIWQFHTTI
jgi:hypothetical protein